jgi:hypothetical protein
LIPESREESTQVLGKSDCGLLGSAQDLDQIHARQPLTAENFRFKWPNLKEALAHLRARPGERSLTENALAKNLRSQD